MSAKDSVVRAEQSEVPPRAAVILTVAMIAAQWMIFDPTKGPSTTTATV